jgi:hypothetical protein
MTAVEYHPESVHLEYLSGTEWRHLAGASVTLSQTYDTSERGVLIPGTDTMDITVSKWVSAPIDLLDQGSVVRLTYQQPGLDELYRGIVSTVSIGYVADPAAVRHGHRWRADYMISTVALAASRLTPTVTWSRLPAETVTARLGRWITSIDLHGVPDATMPAEDAEGSTTLLEVVRAACDYLGRPVRLVDTGTATAIHAVPASTALPAGITQQDALDMYVRSTVQTSAGDRSVSLDADDIAREGSADLAADDVRVLHSPWRIPDPLPVPFADPAPVSGLTQTFTPTGYSASVTFDYSTAHRIRYRPPTAYIPADTDTTKGHGGSTGATGGTGATDTGSIGTRLDGATVGSLLVGGGAKYVMHGHIRLAFDPGFSGDLRFAITSGEDHTGGIIVRGLSSGGTDLGTHPAETFYGDSTSTEAVFAIVIPGTTGQHLQFSISGQIASADGGGAGGPVSVIWEATDTGVTADIDSGGMSWTPLPAPTPTTPGDGGDDGGDLE